MATNVGVDVVQFRSDTVEMTLEAFHDGPESVSVWPTHCGLQFVHVVQ